TPFFLLMRQPSVPRVRPRSSRPSRWRPSRRLVLIVATLVIVGLTVAVISLAVTARTVKNNLQYVAVNTDKLQTALASGEHKSVVKNLNELRASTNAAEHASSGPLWTLASKTPFLGKNLAAVHTSAAVLNDIATKGLTPIVDASGAPSLQTFSPIDGRLDLKSLTELSEAMSTTRAVTERGDQRMEEVDTGRLLPSVAGPVAQIKAKVDTAATIARSTQTALDLLPRMLGAKGKRDYLAIFQNNAEVRSTGGLPGAYALLKVDKGKITIGEQGTGAAFGELPAPILPLTRDEKALYSNKMARYFLDTNFTPDFQRTAQLTRAMVKQEKRVEVDGVISVDPVALSYILAGTGPIKLQGGRLVDSQNVVDVLLNQVYFEITDPTKQDDFFADSASRVFDAVAQGKGNPEVVMSGIVRGAMENRVFVWSKDDYEQKVLRDVRVGGVLTPRNSGSPNVGIFLNDATGAKMQYYLNFKSSVRSSCMPGKRQKLTAKIDLISNAPADAEGLPATIVGPGYGTRPGFMSVNIRVYAPLDGRLVAVYINGRKALFSTHSHDKRPVATIPVQLGPVSHKTVSVTMESGKNQSKRATVAVTPSIQSGKRLHVAASACKR
ncbi:MAG: DUF4012 domain-containing protein, partial [Actinomycetota bacterium]|nr:DUF4012 domain-containing protein [Actinomycetota bacterium]